MLLKILLLIALLLVAGYFWQARKNTRQKLQPLSKNTKTARPAHRCVIIEPGLIPCKAIHAYEGKRILMDKAPTLPVQGCDAKQCECRFQRYDDRRVGPRRTKMKAGNQIMAESNNNKRSRKDRRNS